MKKSIKLSSLIGLLLVIVSVCLLFAGCGEHSHMPANVWTTDEYSHWRECRDDSCDVKINKASHLWSGTQVIQRETFSQEGIYKHTCKVCYTSKTVIKPKLALKGESSIYNISKISKEYDSQPVQEPKFDVIGDGDITFEWYEGEILLDNAPSTIGDYKLIIKISETTDYKPAEVSQDFSITKKQIKKNKLELNFAHTDIFEINDLDSSYGVADGEKVNLRLTFNSINVGASLINAEISGENAENYEITLSNIKASIVKNTPQISFAKGIAQENFYLTYGEPYLSIMSTNDKGTRQNGFNGENGTYFNISEYVQESDIAINYYTQFGNRLSSQPLSAGNYYFEISVKNTINYNPKTFKVIYYIDKLDINVSNITINKVWEDTQDMFATTNFQLTEQNGLVYSDTVYLQITYYGTNIGDGISNCEFLKENVSPAYENYRIFGNPQGEIVGEIKLNYNLCGVTAYVKKHSNVLYSNITCNEVLTFSHLSPILPENSQIESISFINANQENIEFAYVDNEQIIKFNSNLASGGTGADNFEYTNPQGRWSGNKPLVNSQGIKLTLIINLKEQTM